MTEESIDNKSPVPVGVPIETGLARSMGLTHVVMIGVGAMIGAGIFVLTGIAAGVAGPALILVFLLNGVVTTLTALSYAELGSCFPEAVPERILHRNFFGDIPERLARELTGPVILTKAYPGHVVSWFQKLFGTRMPEAHVTDNGINESE